MTEIKSREKVAETLDYCVRNGIVDFDQLCDMVEMKKREKILTDHKAHFSIYLGSDQRWTTHLPNEDGHKGKRIRKTRLEDLEDAVVAFYETQTRQAEKLFKDCYFDWRAVQDELVDPNSVYRYNTEYTRFFEGTDFVNSPVKSLTEDKIKLYFRKMIADHNLNKTSFKHLFGYVKRPLDEAVKQRVIATNPMSGLECKMFYPYCNEIVKPIEKHIVGRADFEAIRGQLKIDHEKNPTYLPSYAVELACFTGMRVSELTALRWSDIHCVEGYKFFTICNSEKYDRINKRYYIGRTKNKKDRIFPISEEVDKLLETLHTVEVENGMLGEFIFCGIHAGVVSSCIKNKCKQLHIAGRGIHALRKTFNSAMRTSGVSEVVASSLLGHSVQTNRTYYTWDVSEVEERLRAVQTAYA